MRTLSNACYLLVICLWLSSLAWSQNTSGSEDRIAFRARQFRFKLEPGESFKFTLPKVDSPIRIEISRRSADGSFSTLVSEVMWALVNVDRKAGQLTWIGTDSAGSIRASNSKSSTSPIAYIWLDAPPDGLAMLSVDNAGARILSVTQSASESKIAGLYLVRMYY
jgi:hypothetical protein